MLSVHKCISSFLFILFALCLFLMKQSVQAQLVQETVQLGIDNLIDMNFEPLKGKKVSILTNTSGRSSQLIPTAQLIAESDQCTLVSILSPEHGYYATIPAGQDVNNDSLWNVPVYSLYGKYRRPSKQMLSDADIIVVDIQDIGIRSYTFISSLYNVMDACAEYGKEVLILDRPNPIGGLIVDGPIADSTLLSFVCIAPIPYIHGLTIGEFALLINKEQMLPKDKTGKARICELSVLKMKYWTRSMTWYDTGLHFCPTSPNIPNPQSIFGAAITGPIGEIGSAGIGVGTTLPFQYIAAPFINSQQLLQEIADNISPLGVQAGIARYRIATGKYPNQDCNGIIVHTLCKPDARPFSAGIEILLGLRRMFPEHFTAEYVKDEPKSMFRKIMSNQTIVDLLLQGGSDDMIRAQLMKGVDEFIQMRKKYLLYSEY